MNKSKVKKEDERAKNQAIAQLKGIVEMVKALDTEDDDEREKAQETINNDPLSVEVRSDWHGLGDKAEDDEFKILLCWGGPAVQIVGELENGQPISATIQYQDWFTGWTDFVIENKEDDEALLTYCQQFYFEY